MIKMNHVLAAMLFASISVAHAETANQPVSQGAASVNKNLSASPDNKGLQNASERLKENEAKVEEKRGDAEKKHEHHEKHEKHEKHDRMDKHDHEKMEHPAKPDRPAR